MRVIRNWTVLCLLSLLTDSASAAGQRWIVSWGRSVVPADSNAKEPLSNLSDQTVRERMRLSTGGNQICLRFSNEHGSSPLAIGSVTVAAPNEAASVKRNSIKQVTFAGRRSITIPAGVPVLSDPLAFPVNAGAEISVSLYFPTPVTTPTVHALALKRAVVSPRGDHTADETIEGGTISESSIAVSAVLTPAQPGQRPIVVFGDSTTDGDGSTIDADNNWPNDLMRRVASTPKAPKLAVVNAGVAGNRLLGDGPFPSFGVSGLARFDRDALAIPGVTHVVLLEGMNDIGFPGAKLGKRSLADPADLPAPEELISAYLQLLARTHAQGVKLIGATITPFEGVDLPGYYSQSKETIRQAVNKWIRTSGSFDGVIDFDAAVRDPEHPSRLSPKFASEDHLHPNDDGYRAMADAIDLALFD